MIDIQDGLYKLEACHSARTWAYDHNFRSWNNLWRSCKRGDWLLWLAEHLLKTAEGKALVLKAACACARLSLHNVRDEKERKELAEMLTLLECETLPTKRKMQGMQKRCQHMEGNKSTCPSMEVESATFAVELCVDFVVDADPAFCVAEHAVTSLEDGWFNEESKTQLLCAKIVRKTIPWPMVKAALEKLDA